MSEVRKPSGAAVKAWFASVRGEDLFLSVLVVGEVRQGIERLRKRDPRQAGTYETWLETLRRDYSPRILPLTVEIAEMWGRLNAPAPLPVSDGFLAATAVAHNMTLVTRDVADVARTGAMLLNPFG